MKRLVTLLLVLVLALSLFAGCGAKEATGEAYATVHGAGYVGKATVTVDGKGKITAATLDEACYPSQVAATESVPEADRGNATSHGSQVMVYKNVKFAGNTLVFDDAANSYKLNGTLFVDWLQTESNAKVYYDAVVANDVAVVVNGKEDKTVMTAAALLKSQNGYGGTKFDWKKNRDATVNYVVANGFAAMASVAKNDDGEFVDSNGVKTGATWTDMNSEKEKSISYLGILKMAYDKVAK